VIGFDKVGSQKSEDDAADLMLESPSRLFVDPVYIDYAVVMPAGEYALSGFAIKVAKSVSDVGYWTANRNELIPKGEIRAGSFTVKPGETVYIGHFFIERTSSGPAIWRFYKTADQFDEYVGGIKKKYKFIDLSDVHYRLFDTKSMGQDYSLEKRGDPAAKANVPE
jgi:hypothetical protein